jgi:hypothetical protein
MKPTTSWIIRIAAGVTTSLALQTVALAGDVSVSVNLNTPGVYGQLTIGGDVPVPELIMPRPVIAVPSREIVPTPPPPLYLHVPPGHERHWARHCHEYDACGRPVYFVSERWYHDVYTPRHEFHEREREEHFRQEMRAHEEHERDMHRQEERDHWREEHREHDRDYDRHDHDHDRDHDRDYGHHDNGHHDHGHDDHDHDHR